MLRLSSRLRFTACLMVGAYPLVTAVLAVLQPFTLGWSLPARTALAVPLIVAAMVFAVIPMVHRLAGRWIKAGA
jgi:antibiotic biosynthesis monooxygenase (ABM) superfamily enzyme